MLHNHRDHSLWTNGNAAEEEKEVVSSELQGLLRGVSKTGGVSNVSGVSNASGGPFCFDGTS